MRKTSLLIAIAVQFFGLGLTVAPAQTAPPNGTGNADPCNNPGKGRPAWCENPLPVTVVSFKANPYSEGVRLEWVTANQVNHNSYIIERSEDGRNFVELARLMGFAFVDLKPSALNYYRLVSEDTDGTRHNYNIIAVRYKTGLFRVCDLSGVLIGIYTSYAEIPTGKPILINGVKTIISG